MSITFIIHVEKYVESMLNIYFPFAKASSHVNALLFFVLYAWGLPQVLYSYITAMSKYSNDILGMYPNYYIPTAMSKYSNINLEFLLNKFFTFA